MRKLVLAAALMFAVASPAFAGCDDLVTDDVGLIDVAKVTEAARKAVSKGAMVRVRVVKNLAGAKNTKQFEDSLEAQCAWQSGGRRLSNLLSIPLSVEHGDMTVATGSAIETRIPESVGTKAIADFVIPKWKVRKTEPNAVTEGLVAMLDSFTVELGKPIGGAGNTTIINNQAGDSSWFGKMMIGLAVLALLGFGGVFYLRSSQDKSEAAGLAAETYRIRADCRTRLLSLNDDLMVLQARTDKAVSQPDYASIKDLMKLKSG